MNATVIIGSGVLVMIIALCAAGIYFRCYRENWLQWIGMWVIGLAACFRLWSIVSHVLKDEPARMSLPQFWLYTGVLTFGLGMAWKVWKIHREQSS